MNCSRLWFLSAIAALPMACVWADDPPPPNGIWTGKGQAGFVGSQGNTDAESLNAAIDMALVDNQWKHALHFGALYGESSGITAAERWDALWQSNYSLTNDLYTFGALRYEHDDFSGFEYQGSGAVGLGYKILNTDATKLSGQVGVGYRKSQPEELTKDASGAVISRTLEPSTSDAILTAGVDFSQVITSPTNDDTILPNAAPTMTPTAISMTLPFIANSLNSDPILTTPSPYLLEPWIQPIPS